MEYTHAELKLAYEAWISGKKMFFKEPGGLPVNIPRDIHLLYPMLVPAAGEKRFNCKHQSKNGDCSIYDIRPQMCRDYPYGKVCPRKSCTMEETA